MKQKETISREKYDSLVSTLSIVNNVSKEDAMIMIDRTFIIECDTVRDMVDSCVNSWLTTDDFKLIDKFCEQENHFDGYGIKRLLALFVYYQKSRGTK